MAKATYTAYSGHTTSRAGTANTDSPNHLSRQNGRHADWSVDASAGMTQPLVSIVIVTYNRWDLLQDCLEAIDTQSYRNVETIVVDNGTDDETRIGLAHRSDVLTIRSPNNTGFAGGNNLAVKHASGQYIFLLNNDAFLGKLTLKQVVEYLEQNPVVAIAQPTIAIGNWPQRSKIKGQLLSNGAGSFLTKWGFLWHRGLRNRLNDLPSQPDHIFSTLGAGMLIRRSAIERHGLFDESFFAYFEETEFCWRLWTRGQHVAYVPSDPMLHIGGQTSKEFNEKVVIFYAYRNRIISFWRHLEIWHLVQILFLHHLAILGLMLVLLPKRPAASGWMLAVLIWELTHPLTLLKTRAQHMRRRAVRDREIWSTIYRPISLRQMLGYLR